MRRRLTADDWTIYKYYLTRATGHPGFIWPVYLLYVLAHGVTYTEIGLIGTVQALIVVGGEIPTGYVGDRVGRRNSLLIGSVLFTTSAASYLLVDTFLGFVFTFALLSFANTFVSGSADAWLYDTLAEQGADDRYTHVSGRGSAVSQWVMTATMIASGLLYAVDPTYPFVAQVALGVANVVATLSLPKNAQYADPEAAEDRFTIIDALPVVRQQLTQPPLRSFVVYMALFSGALMTADAYVQPVAVGALEADLSGLFDSLGIPESATMGFLYASFTLVSACTANYAGTVEDRLGVRRSILIIPFVIAAFYLLPVFVPLLAFPMFFVMKGSGSLLRPITTHYLNRHVESVGRATILSAVSMVYGLARVPFAVGSGIVADAATPRAAVAALGVAFVVGAVLAHLWEAPVPVGATNTESTAD